MMVPDKGKHELPVSLGMLAKSSQVPELLSYASILVNKVEESWDSLVYEPEVENKKLNFGVQLPRDFVWFRAGLKRLTEARKTCKEHNNLKDICPHRIPLYVHSRIR